MRNCISFIILFLVFVNQGLGQDLRNQGNSRANGSSEDLEDNEKIEELNVESKIGTWTLEEQFASIDSSSLDSSMINFHNYNPIFKQSISNNYLGYVGSPYESNVFFNRDSDSEFYFLQNLSAYRLETSDVKYYNTTTPFASLLYQGTSEIEQTFDAFFTRNIDSLTNFGFRFHVLKNETQLLNQEARHKYLNAFVSRNTDRYNAYFSIINGSNDLIENGGITDPASYVEAAPDLNLKMGYEALNTSFSLFSSFEYLMGEIPFLTKSLDDSISKSFTPRYAAQYSIEYNNYNRQMVEEDVDTDFFDASYLNDDSFTDSVRFTKFSHLFQLKALESENRKFTFGKRAFIENEIVTAVHPLPDGARTYNYANVYLGGELYRSTSKFWNWKVNARFALLGRNLGDALVKGEIEKPIVLANDTTKLSVQGWYEDISPNIFQEHWYGNHYKWENNFKKQHEVVIRSKFQYPRLKTQVGIDYALYSNYFYNNEQALPDQYSGEFSVISAWLNKDFVLGRFTWSNKMVWQGLSNDVVLHLPTWSMYSSLYYSHYLFKVMKIQLGAEIYYHSKFKGDYYDPTTTHFYLQNELSTSGFSTFNLYANAKLARTSAFAQLVNVNRNGYYDFGEKFSSPLYPLEQMVFRFGFYWTFYD